MTYVAPPDPRETMIERLVRERDDAREQVTDCLHRRQSVVRDLTNLRSEHSNLVKTLYEYIHSNEIFADKNVLKILNKQYDDHCVTKTVYK